MIDSGLTGRNVKSGRLDDNPNVGVRSPEPLNNLECGRWSTARARVVAAAIDFVEIEASMVESRSCPSRCYSDNPAIEAAVPRQQLPAIREERRKAPSDVAETYQGDIGAPARAHATASRTLPTSSSAEATYAG